MIPMPTFELKSGDGWIRVRTWKEGLLSRMGHDLLLDVQDFSVRAEEAGEMAWDLRVFLNKDSFAVREPADLSDKDKAEIHRNICNHLPDHIHFTGRMEKTDHQSLAVEGEIALGPARTPRSFVAPLHNGLATGRVELSHEVLQLKPYRAPLGLIRLQDRLELSFSFDLSEWLDGQET